MSNFYRYSLHMPENLVEGKQYPVIFALHGKGSNENDMLSLLAPVQDEFILVGIRGNMPMGFGFQYYDLKSLGNPIREQFDETITQLHAFIQQICDDFPIDPASIFLLGFSQGSILSSSLVLTMGEEIKGAVLLNGYVPDFVKDEYTLKPIEEVKLFISHGQFDSVFPISIGEQTAKYFEERSNHVTFLTYPSDHGVSQHNATDIINWLRAHIRES